MSAVDAVVLLVAAPTTWLAWTRLGPMAGVIPFTVLHFFLFCNVVRIHRRKELLWAATAVVNVSAWFLADRGGWPAIIASQVPVTALLILTELRLPRYHGVAADRLNPRLQEWLVGKV